MLTLTFKVLPLPVLLGHAVIEVMLVLIFDLYEAGQSLASTRSASWSLSS